MIPDPRRGGDRVFPLSGRDVEVYLPGEYDPVIQYRGMRCIRTIGAAVTPSPSRSTS